MFRGSDANPKERFVWHEAGLLGRGGSSYIDTVILRDRDANSGWTSAADGTLEERIYYAQNWRADVSVVLSSGGLVKEWVKYSAYGVPYSITPGDFDADGFLASNDSDEFDAAYNGGAGAWDARVDLNLDGSLTSADETIFTDEFNNGEAAGLGVLSRSMVANRNGYAGYQHARELTGAKWHVRHRVLDSETGRWTRRDPLGYVDGMNLYGYVASKSVVRVDPNGLVGKACPDQCWMNSTSLDECLACCEEQLGTPTVFWGCQMACRLTSFDPPPAQMEIPDSIDIPEVETDILPPGIRRLINRLNPRIIDLDDPTDSYPAEWTQEPVERVTIMIDICSF